MRHLGKKDALRALASRLLEEADLLEACPTCGGSFQHHAWWRSTQRAKAEGQLRWEDSHVQGQAPQKGEDNDAGE